MLMAKAVQVIPLGLSYALWSGIGIIAIVLVGVLAYRQIPTTAQMLGLALLTVGVVGGNPGGWPLTPSDRSGGLSRAGVGWMRVVLLGGTLVSSLSHII